jgi:hypothetical protein
MAQLSLEEMKDIQKPGMTKEEADMAYFEKRYQERVIYLYASYHWSIMMNYILNRNFSLNKGKVQLFYHFLINLL